MFIKALFFTAVLLTCAAQSNAARVLQNVMVLEGTCGKFQALDIDLTPQCQGKLSSNIFSDSRNSFTFIIQPPGKPVLIFTFTGMGNGQVKQGEDAAVQPVDGLITNVDGKSSSERAVGICRFRNPYKPAAIVVCSAETSDGRYEGSFATNGKPPSLMRPNR